MKKLVISLFFLCTLHLALSTAAYGSFDFPAKYEVTYTYSLDRATKVHKKITLTNRFSQLYPTSYQLEITGETPENIIARDNGGQLEYKTIPSGGDTLFYIFEFNRPVPGKGKSYTFDVYYDLPTPVSESSLWKIALPQAGNIDPNDIYNLNLLVPSEYGPLITSEPKPYSISTSSHPGFHHLSYASDSLVTKGGIAQFGYAPKPLDISLKYPLQLFPPLVTKLKLEITNPNHISQDPQTIYLESKNLPLVTAELQIPRLDPDQTLVIDVPLKTIFVPQLLPKSLTLTIAEEQIHYNIPDYLFFGWYGACIIIITSTLAYCGHSAHKAGSLHLQRRKK